MSCSKNSTIKDMLSKGLVKPNLELNTKSADLRLSKYIDRITSLAKNKYGVDMGPLFTVKAGLRSIKRGERGIGDTNFTTRLALEANDPAFEAIDMSKQAADNIEIARIQKEKYQEIKESLLRQLEANEQITEEGDVVAPNPLPLINIKC